MEITTLVPVLLPIVLFVITLIIIMVMREQDNHKRGVANVRKLTDQLKNEIFSQEDEFKAQITELDAHLEQKNAQIQGFFQDIDNQLKKIDSYSVDMAKIKSAMETYREALCGLAKLTQEADAKISLVEEDIAKLEEVRKVVDGFKLDMKDADDHLKQHEGVVIQMERDTIGRMEDRCKALSEDFSIKIDRLCDQLDIKVEATRDATESLMNQGAEVLGTIGDRTAEQVQLSSQVRELARQKERLLSDINTLNHKVAEKQARIEESEIDLAAEPVMEEPEDIPLEDFAEEPEPVEQTEIEDTEIKKEEVEIEEPEIVYEGEEEEIVFD